MTRVSESPALATGAPGSTESVVARGRDVLRMERDAIDEAAGRLDERFARAVQLIASSTGRVIVTGVGKSGLIARKIAATLTSTGTPSTFLHPVESFHGDLGIVDRNDVAIMLSKSGESVELLELLEHLARLGVKSISITGNSHSRLARHSDVALDGWVREEACPHDLAPTTSTTVALALGDALAVALLEAKGFAAEDFARLHPGGALGRRLLTRVADVMLTNDLPILSPDGTMRQAIVLLAEKRGLAIVRRDDGSVDGVLTAGDLARAMERHDDIMSVPVGDVLTRNPKMATQDELGSAVVYRMEKHGIMAMPVVDDAAQLVGVVHLHDLMRAGAV